MCFMLAYLLFVEFGYRQSETYYMANLWYSASFIWTIAASLILHVVLIITGRFNSKEKIILPLIYVPSLIISAFFLRSNLTSVNIVKEYWGWTYSTSLNPLLFNLSNLWITLLIAASIILAYLHYRKSDDGEQKLAKYIVLGLSITLAAGVITDNVLPLLSIRIPETIYTVAALSIAFLCYGIIRYRIPQLTPSMAAEEIVSVMSNFLVLIDEKKRIKNVNPTGLRLSGYNESEIYGKDMKMLFPDDLSLSEAYNFSKEHRSNFETVMNTKESKFVPVLMSVTPIIFNSQKLGILCVGSDITRLKQEELHKSRVTQQTIERQNILLELFQKDLSNLPGALQRINEASSKTLDVDHVSIWLFNNDKTKIICKDRYNLKDNSHKHGYILEAADYPIYFEAIKKFHSITAANAQKYHYTSEFNESYLQPKGIFSLMDVPIWLEGDLVGMLCHENSQIRHWTFEDQDLASSMAHLISLGLEASKRKKAEKKLKTSLEEKELLMKEIHHRVKNNLQIISSLLNLQSRYINDKEALDVFKESQNRARSMALIHEKLYSSSDLRKINFGEYIRSLTMELFSSYQMSPGIKLDINVDNVDLDINTSVPLALIVNEIVTNSLKYAFPGEETGNISVSFDKKADELQLTVEDNGIGFPSGMDFKNTDSLGMQLVNSLTDQINGKITLEETEGTKFVVNFKEEFYGD